MSESNNEYVHCILNTLLLFNLGLKWTAFENSSELSLGVTNYADAVKYKGTPECEEINKHLPKDINLMMQVYELPLYDLGKHSKLISNETYVLNTNWTRLIFYYVTAY